MGSNTRRSFSRGAQIATGVCALLLTLGVGLIASGVSPVSASFDGLPTETPRRDVPKVLDGTVLSGDQVGDFIVVGGEFNQVEAIDGRVFNTSGVYAYHADTGALITAFLPDVGRTNGSAPSIEVIIAADDEFVFLGGQFNSVDGQTHHRVVKISVVTGVVESGFVADFNSRVTAMTLYNGRLIVGGDFTSVNGTPRQRLADVNANTGSVSSSFRFDVTESSRINSSFTYGPKHLGISGNGILVVAHRGERVDGFYRPGLALIDLKSNNLLGYSTDFWAGGEIFIRDADVSPDGSYVVVVSNGGDFPLDGKDVGIRFDIADPHTSNQSERWIARNFDSTYSVAISNSAVYMGGHFCNVEGPGSPVPFPGVGEYGNDNSCFGLTPASRFPTTVNRDQLAAFNPLTGTALDWDPGADGLVGVQSLEVIDRGLLIGHDGTYIGRDGADRRAWNVGRHGFLDIENPNGLSNFVGGPVPTCNGLPATIVGTDGDDVITGTSGNDVIVSLAGRDTINALGGHDVICAGTQNDIVYGGDGNDVIHGNEAADRLYGGNGDDLIYGGLWRDTIYGGPGNDELRGGGGNDTIFGGSGNDSVYGWTGIDLIDGGGGHDDLFGQVGRDQIQGNSGSDDVHGGIGRDRCRGAVWGNADSPGDTRVACEY